LAKADFPELATLNAQALPQVLKRLEAAFIDMKRKGMGFPSWRRVSF
jgi:putative transposase